MERLLESQDDGILYLLTWCGVHDKTFRKPDFHGIVAAGCLYLISHPNGHWSTHPDGHWSTHSNGHGNPYSNAKANSHIVAHTSTYDKANSDGATYPNNQADSHHHPSGNFSPYSDRDSNSNASSHGYAHTYCHTLWTIPTPAQPSIRHCHRGRRTSPEWTLHRGPGALVPFRACKSL